MKIKNKKFKADTSLKRKSSSRRTTRSSYGSVQSSPTKGKSKANASSNLNRNKMKTFQTPDRANLDIIGSARVRRSRSVDNSKLQKPRPSTGKVRTKAKNSTVKNKIAAANSKNKKDSNLEYEIDPLSQPSESKVKTNLRRPKRSSAAVTKPKLKVDNSNVSKGVVSTSPKISTRTRSSLGFNADIILTLPQPVKHKKSKNISEKIATSPVRSINPSIMMSKSPVNLKSSKRTRSAPPENLRKNTHKIKVMQSPVEKKNTKDVTDSKVVKNKGKSLLVKESPKEKIMLSNKKKIKVVQRQTRQSIGKNSVQENTNSEFELSVQPERKNKVKHNVSDKNNTEHEMSSSSAVKSKGRLPKRNSGTNIKLSRYGKNSEQELPNFPVGNRKVRQAKYKEIKGTQSTTDAAKIEDAPKNILASSKDKNSRQQISTSPILKPKEKKSKVIESIEEKSAAENVQPKTRSSMAKGRKSMSLGLQNKRKQLEANCTPKRTSLGNAKNSRLSSSLSREDPRSDSVIKISSSIEPVQKKTKSKQTLNVSQKALKLKKQASLSVVEPSCGENDKAASNELKKSTNRATSGLLALVQSAPIAPTSRKRKKTSSTQLQKGVGSSTDNKKVKKNKVSRGVKRKSDESPSKNAKRKRTSTVDVTKQDPISSTPGPSKSHTRRHTLPKTKGPLNKSISQKKEEPKKSSVKSTKPKSVSGKSKDDLDISLIPIDCIATFNNKRPKSAPAALKKKPKSKDSISDIPKKGTLKRKRWLLNALKENDDSYEDDIFEGHKFATPFRLPYPRADDESDTSIATPKFGFVLTPALQKKAPKFKEIVAPADLSQARKSAEEYLYRRHKKRANNDIVVDLGPRRTELVPEKKKLEFADVMEKAEALRKRFNANSAEESDEDNYFTCED